MYIAYISSYSEWNMLGYFESVQIIKIFIVL